MSRYIPNVEVPAGSSGPWTISKFTVSEEDASFSRIRALQSGRGIVSAGEYTKLTRNGLIVMSDTRDEKRDHIGFVLRAKGRVLIAGLGLGMVLNAVLLRDGVEHVTVIEKSQDVIDLVGPYYKKKFGDRLTIICADIFEWKPPKGEKWDAIWFDIWDELCEDNLKQMTKLKRKFGRRAPYKGCWSEDYVRARRARSRW